MAVSLVRRWAVPDRPQDEILTLLAHCFYIVDGLLLHAREVLRCHKAKPFAQVDGAQMLLPPPNTVVRRGIGDR
jgi:hypothetical protein